MVQVCQCPDYRVTCPQGGVGTCEDKTGCPYKRACTHDVSLMKVSLIEVTPVSYYQPFFWFQVSPFFQTSQLCRHLGLFLRCLSEKCYCTFSLLCITIDVMSYHYTDWHNYANHCYLLLVKFNKQREEKARQNEDRKREQQLRAAKVAEEKEKKKAEKEEREVQKKTAQKREKVSKQVLIY